MQSWQHWSYLYPQKRQSHHSFPLGSQILWVEAERPPSLSSLWWPHSRGHGRSLWPFLDWMWSMCGKWWPLGSPSVSLVMDGKRSLLLATCKIRKYISVSESSFISVAPYYVHGTIKGKLEESFLFWLLPENSNRTIPHWGARICILQWFSQIKPEWTQSLTWQWLSKLIWNFLSILPSNFWYNTFAIRW